MSAVISPEVAAYLESEAARVHVPDFVLSDPVQFPRRFSDLRDIEVTAILASHLAWGNRKMICRDIERLLSLADNMPAAWIAEGAFEEVPDEQNIHRTFFGRNLKHFCRGLRRIISRHGSLDAFCAASGAPDSEFPAWALAEAINAELAAANSGQTDSRCLPLSLSSTALKRLNMALRWLVRRDEGIVDLGVWDSLKPSQLFIPLDVHVGDTSRSLGLLTRKANDRLAATTLTDALRTLRPSDPTYFDFALFGSPVTPQ